MSTAVSQFGVYTPPPEQEMAGMVGFTDRIKALYGLVDSTSASSEQVVEEFAQLRLQLRTEPRRSLTLEDMFWVYMTILADEHPELLTEMDKTLDLIETLQPNLSLQILAIRIDLDKHREA